MAVQRFLGPGWASVHGPTDERKLAIWALDLGFAGIAVGPSPRPVGWAALRSQLADLPFSLPALLVSGSNAGLASPHDGDRIAAIEAIVAAARTAASLGIDTLVFEPGNVAVPGEIRANDVTDPAADWSGDYATALLARRGIARDRSLDRICRTLFEVSRAAPDLTLALAPSRCVTGLGEPVALAAIFEDLPNTRLAFWANPAIAACRNQVLGEDQGAWLDRLADRIVGLSLGDAADGRADLPPGAGLVDYSMLSNYVRRQTPVPGVLELDPGIPAGEIAGVHSFLSKFGL